MRANSQGFAAAERTFSQHLRNTQYRPSKWRAFHTVLRGTLSRLPEVVQLTSRRIFVRPRKLPDFLVIGAMKAGTTSFYQHLTQHPQVIPALRKEIRYFDLLHHAGLEFYQLFFPTISAANTRRGTSSRPALTGEASPYYLFNPHVPERVAAVIPQARIFILLRDPVARAYSHYLERVRDGFETRPFDEAVEQELAQLEEGPVDFSDRNRLIVDGRGVNYRHPYFAYLACGRYAEQIERWYQHFAQEQFVILKAENVFSEPQAAYRRAWEALDLPAIELPKYINPNYGGKRSMNPVTQQLLNDFYRPHNDHLAQLLGPEFQWAPQPERALA